MKNLLGSLFEGFNKNIRYAVLRNYKDLPYAIGNDLDLLVHPGDKNKAIFFLERACRQNGYRIIQTTRRLHYIGFYLVENEGSEIILIDVFTGLFKAWRKYADVNRILSNRVYRWGFYSVSLEDELSTIVSKELLTYGRVRSKYEDRFEEIFNEQTFEFARCNFDCLTLKSRTDLLSISNIEEIFEERKVRVKAGSALNFANYIRFRVTEILIRIFKKPLFIVFIGPDGIGKSTMSEELKNLLQSNNLYAEIKVYHHRFDFIPQLSRLKRDRHVSKRLSTNRSAKNSEIVLHSPIRTLIYMVYYGLDYLIGYFDIWRRKMSGGGTIFDRYLYDFNIQKSYSSIPSRVKKIYANIFPSPSLIVFLYANPHIVVKRKQELSLEDHIEQNSECLKLLRAHKNKAVFCNCNESLESAVIRMKRLVLARL